MARVNNYTIEDPNLFVLSPKTWLKYFKPEERAIILVNFNKEDLMGAKIGDLIEHTQANLDRPGADAALDALIRFRDQCLDIIAAAKEAAANGRRAAAEKKKKEKIDLNAPVRKAKAGTKPKEEGATSKKTRRAKPKAKAQEAAA